MEIPFSKNVNLGFAKSSGPAQNLAIEAVLLFIICALFIWFILLPKRTEIQTKLDALTQLTSQEKDIKTQSDALKKMLTDLAAHQDDIKELDKALPLSSNQPQLESLMNQLAKSVGVNLSSMNLSGIPDKVAAGDKQLLADPFKPSRTLQKISGDMYIKGNFNQLLSFLQELESSGRLINITDMQMDSGSDGFLNLRLSIIAYVYGT